MVGRRMDSNGDNWTAKGHRHGAKFLRSKYTMKIERISLLETFARVVEAGSFSSVARDLGVSQSTVSRRLVELENNLGVRLLNRNTRTIVPTRDGKVFYSYACKIVEIADEAAHEISGDASGLGGLVRIGTSAAFGNSHLLPLLPEILERWPMVSIDVRYLEGMPDMLSHGLDIAIWSGDVTDQSLIKRKIGTSQWMLVASKMYLDRSGRPETLDDLPRHSFVHIRDVPFDRERYDGESEEKERARAIAGSVSVDSVEAAVACARSDLGITLVPQWLFDKLPGFGDLERVLPDTSVLESDIQLLFPSRRVPARTRALLDFLAKNLMEQKPLA